MMLVQLARAKVLDLLMCSCGNYCAQSLIGAQIEAN